MHRKTTRYSPNSPRFSSSTSCPGKKKLAFEFEERWGPFARNMTPTQPPATPTPTPRQGSCPGGERQELLLRCLRVAAPIGDTAGQLARRVRRRSQPAKQAIEQASKQAGRQSKQADKQAGKEAKQGSRFSDATIDGAGGATGSFGWVFGWGPCCSLNSAGPAQKG